MKKMAIFVLLFLGMSSLVNLNATETCYQITSHENQGIYIGVNGGPNWLDGSRHLRSNTEMKTGFMCSGVLGYKSSPFYSSSTCTFFPRVEAEISYRYNAKSRIKNGGESFKSSSCAHSLVYMTNFLVDADFGMPLTPYLGLGIGFGHGWGNGNREPYFAYQGIAGVSYSICEKVDVTVEYRYLKLGKRENHAAVFGIKKYF